MVAILRTFLGLIVIAPVAVFCGLNIHTVSVTYSPFHDSIDVPLYAVGLCLAVFGVLFGSFSTWLNAAPLRKERRVLNKRVKFLEKELKFSQKDVGNKETALVAKVEKEVLTPVPE
jgi:uncharacterized integral membrane protein